MKKLFAVVVATLVGVAVWLGFGLYTWTAIHNGWSDFGLQMFRVAMWVVPVVVGVGAGRAVYRV